MTLITCGECGNQVSSTAKNCPSCGARVKPKSKLWLWLIGVPIGIFVIFAIIGSNDPQKQAKRNDRRVYELCIADMNDPLRSPGFRAASRSMCEKLRDDFRAKYNLEP